MKKLVGFSLFLAAALSLSAQSRQEGLALCYFDDGGEILYATHKTEPFGTKLVVINPANEAQITVQVSGRPEPNSIALIEIPQRAGEELGLNIYYANWVWIYPIRTATVAPQIASPSAAQAGQQSPRPKVASFKQAGTAVVVAGSTMSVSHPSLPLGTRLRLTSDAGRTISVTVSGRIRAGNDRIIEISQAAARSLGIDGTNARVKLETLE